MLLFIAHHPQLANKMNKQCLKHWKSLHFFFCRLSMAGPCDSRYSRGPSTQQHFFLRQQRQPRADLLVAQNGPSDAYDYPRTCPMECPPERCRVPVGSMARSPALPATWLKMPQPQSLSLRLIFTQDGHMAEIPAAKHLPVISSPRAGSERGHWVVCSRWGDTCPSWQITIARRGFNN